MDMDGRWLDGSPRIICAECGKCITHSIADIKMTWAKYEGKDIPHLLCEKCEAKK